MYAHDKETLAVSVSPVNDYPAAYVMNPPAGPSTIVLSTYNDGSAFTVDSPKAAIVIAMADPHVDILSERWHCNAQSHKRRNNQKPAPHRSERTCELLGEGGTCWLRIVGGRCCGLIRG